MKTKKDLASMSGHSLSQFGSAIVFTENQILNSSKGHGFAAEKANNLIDNFLSKNASIVGGNNRKNGPDRLVDKVEIQTKYCKTASETISALFEKGEYRYFDSNKELMVTEVPKDQYKKALSIMEEKIRDGKVPGTSDPEMAEKLIRKGHITYEQAVNIAKVGTIESLTFDIQSGVVFCSYAFGLSALISFAQGRWSGKSNSQCIKLSLSTASKVFCISLVSHVLTQQLSRTVLNKSISSGATSIAIILPKGLRNNMANVINPKVMPNSIASISTVSKALRSKAIMSAVTTVVLSSKDIYHFSRSEISGLQCFKNICVTGGSVFGGSMGFWLGACLGSGLGPIGTWGGGIAGSMIAGTLTGQGTKMVVDLLGEDDIAIMQRILDKQLARAIKNYILVGNELSEVSRFLKMIDWRTELKKMHASSNMNRFAYQLFESIVMEVAFNRKLVRC